ncbi:MAG: nucleotidyltransferase family protein, partial [Solirubrobacterales bacterium]|nr:nucleotidyltransferase family protein [Solirubrobacterales bacterium]
MRPIRVKLSTTPGEALPNAGEQLLLRAALLEGPQACAAWADWRRAGGTIDSVDKATFRLLPLLYRNLANSGLDDPDLPRLKGVYRHVWAANQQLVWRVGTALNALRREGIPTMLLKGAAVGLAHYRDLGARPMDDIDVLVPPHEAERAIAVLGASGWTLLARIDRARVLRSVHGTLLRQPDGALIDLHWRALPESIGDEDFWSGSLAVTLGDAATQVPGVTEQLLHSCVHGLRHGPASLRWIADAEVIVRSAGAEIDWARLVDGAAARRVVLRTATALAVLRGLLGSPVPDQVMVDLDALHRGSLERIVHWLVLRPIHLDGYITAWDAYRRLADARDDR